jgi:Mg2+-importing ATPase
MTFFLLFKIFGLHDGAFQAGWFIESLATQTLVIFIIRTRKIPFIESQPSKYLVITAIAVLLSSLLLIQPLFANLFGFEPLGLQVIVVIYLLVGIYLCIVELAKQFFYHRLYPKDRM